jgi:pimeloyl-ACP methyl ester carboxylesterase
MAALQLPVVLTKLAYLIDNPWSVSMTRADMAGLIMADSLIDRNLGARPITLVGFSLGSRVIFSCLRELARKGAIGLIQNVYVFGSPVVINKDEWLKAQSVVSGRFVNGYANNDWILGIPAAPRTHILSANVLQATSSAPQQAV